MRSKASVWVMLTAILAMADVDLFEKLQSQVIETSDLVIDRVVHIEAVGRKNQKTMKVLGSGLIIDSAGRVITNEHVVDKAEKITVTVPGLEDKLTANIVGTDKMTDLALLQMEHPLDYKPIKWANIKHVRVGEWAIAIGNPYGLDGTVSLGIISAKGRAVPTEGMLNDFIQTDAMVDYGSSGGPLINLKGEVLGINSMMMGRGIGFTVPADVVQEIIQKLRKGGKIERSWIGIGIQPLSREHAEYFGIPDKRGVIVTGIFERGPAERAGLKAGDIILSVDGNPVDAEKEEDLNQFKRMVADHKIGDKVTFEVYSPRKKSFRKIRVKTASQPTTKPKELDIQWGFTIKEITPILHRQNFLFSKQGVVVTYVQSASDAQVAGLETWDIIQAIDQFSVKSFADFEKAYRKVKKNNKIMLTVLRNRDIYFVLIQKYGKRSQGN